jgi:guanosine-3',5'-bis(diphosphate) 3'-pyrophosphohydrolase
VKEVTDDKALLKEGHKRLQIACVADGSSRAKLLKLADKICNLRDIGAAPPANWSLTRKREYIDALTACACTHAMLEKLFDQENARRPRLGLRKAPLRRDRLMT